MIASVYHQLEDARPYVIVYHGDDDTYRVGMGRVGVGKALLDVLIEESDRGLYASPKSYEDALNTSEAEHDTLWEERRALEAERDALEASGVSAPQIQEIMDRQVEEARLRVAKHVRAVSRNRDAVVIHTYRDQLVREAKAGTVDVQADVPVELRAVFFTERSKHVSVGAFLQGFLMMRGTVTIHDPSGVFAA